MNQIQSNQLDMFRVINLWYEANKAAIDTMPARATAFANHKSNLAIIENLVGLQTSNTTGHAKDKKSARAALQKQTILHILPTKAYASVNDNHTLRANMDFKMYQLNLMKDDSIGPWCKQRLELVSQNLASLTDYGITAESITTWQTALDNYTAHIAKPRNAIVKHAGTTHKLEKQFSVTNKNLYEIMDPLMAPIQFTNPGLHASYLFAREIIDRG